MRRAWLALVLAAVLAAPAEATAAKLPDLEQVAPYRVRVVEREGRYYLGFATAVRNIGTGALRLRGEGVGNGEMTARQLSEDGLEVLNPNVGILRYVAALGHAHWHYMGFMRYELRGLEVAAVLHDRKQGFCLFDAPFVSDWCAPHQPTLTTTELGIRPGGIDVYHPNVEGQEIEIDPQTTPSGDYVLTSRIGPTDVIRETRTDNNVASTVVSLQWPVTGGPGVAPVGSCLGEGCATPRMTAAQARRLARIALRRTLRRSPTRLKVRCRKAGTAAYRCRIRGSRGGMTYRGKVRVWHALDGAATRWYYSVDVVRRLRGCSRPRGCTRRIRRLDRTGGTVRASALARRANGSPFVCRVA